MERLFGEELKAEQARFAGGSSGSRRRMTHPRRTGRSNPVHRAFGQPGEARWVVRGEPRRAGIGACSAPPRPAGELRTMRTFDAARANDPDVGEAAPSVAAAPLASKPAVGAGTGAGEHRAAGSCFPPSRWPDGGVHDHRDLGRLPAVWASRSTFRSRFDRSSPTGAEHDWHLRHRRGLPLLQPVLADLSPTVPPTVPARLHSART